MFVNTFLKVVERGRVLLVRDSNIQFHCFFGTGI